MSNLGSSLAAVGSEPDVINGRSVNGTSAWQPENTDATETTGLLSAGARGGSDGLRKDSWAGYDDFKGLPWWRTPSVYWLLGPYFIFTLAFGGIIVPKLNLIVDLVCRKYFADQTLADPTFTFAPVILGADNPQCFIPEVKKNVSMFTLALNLVTGILSSLVVPKVGHLSDRYGRRKLLAFASLGGIVAEVITILCAKYPDVINYKWMVLGSICDGLTGSFTAGGVLANSYCSDCTPPSKRGVAIGYLYACLFSGLAFGPLLAGYFVTWTGSLLSIFYVTTVCHILFILFVGFVVPESLSKKRQLLARESHATQRQEGQRSRFPLKILYQTGPGSSTKLRINLLSLSLIDMILFGAAMGAMTVILLYSESENTWGWGTLEASRFISAISTVRVVALLMVMPAINYIFRTRPAARRLRETGLAAVESNRGADAVDVWLLRFGLFSDFIGAVGYLLARNQAVFILSGMVTAFGGLGSATSQSAVTKHVPQGQTGQVLGAIGFLHSLSRVLSPVAFNTLYYATVGKFDQAIFVLLVSLFGLGLLASMLVRPHVYVKTEDEYLQEPTTPVGVAPTDPEVL